jgi:uncharacterized membrane protein YhfC
MSVSLLIYSPIDEYLYQEKLYQLVAWWVFYLVFLYDSILEAYTHVKIMNKNELFQHELESPLYWHVKSGHSIGAGITFLMGNATSITLRNINLKLILGHN